MVEQENKQKEMQEKFFELQMMQKQMQELHKQIEQAEEQIMEVEYLQQSIQELSETKNGNEILIPIANGIFTKAKLEDPKHFIVNIGAETCVQRNHEQVIQMLAKQAEHIAQVHEQMQGSMQGFMDKLKNAEKDLNDGE